MAESLCYVEDVNSFVNQWYLNKLKILNVFFDAFWQTYEIYNVRGVWSYANV